MVPLQVIYRDTLEMKGVHSDQNVPVGMIDSFSKPELLTFEIKYLLMSKENPLRIVPAIV